MKTKDYITGSVETTISFLDYEIDLTVQLAYSVESDNEGSESYCDVDDCTIVDYTAENIQVEGVDRDSKYVTDHYFYKYYSMPFPCISSYIKSELRGKAKELCNEHNENN